MAKINTKRAIVVRTGYGEGEPKSTYAFGPVDEPAPGFRTLSIDGDHASDRCVLVKAEEGSFLRYTCHGDGGHTPFAVASVEQA